MDDTDEEQFLQAALGPPPAVRATRSPAWDDAQVGPWQADGEREHQLLGPAGAPSAMRLRGLSSYGRERVKEEAQLLAALEVSGLTAAPAVLEIEEEGYVRECAPAIGRRRGRRAAPPGIPSTAERNALGQARESLDALIDALHARGWVLGAEHGTGIGVRADGTVLVTDLRGLRQEGGLTPQRQDRGWVDSVLEDGDRTLRRRVHQAPRSGESVLLLETPPPAADGSSVPGPAPDAAHPFGLRPLTALSGRVIASVGDVLRVPRLRRTALLSAGAVLVGGGALVLGAWWMSERATPPQEGTAPAVVATDAEEERPAPAAEDAPPRIEDPWALAAELAGARHAYVTGVSDEPAAAAGSDALVEDREVRAAYTGLAVHGGGPVVHAAEVVEEPRAEGGAVLRVITSTEAYDLETAEGGTAEVPASGRAAVLLTLHWDGAAWEILAVEQESDHADPS